MLMALDRYRLATNFQLHVFERQVSNIDDIKELRRLSVRLHSTILHQQKLYEALIKEGDRRDGSPILKDPQQ